MSPSGLPAQDYVTDYVTGTISGSHLYIDLDSPEEPLLVQGRFALRYAIPVLVPPGTAIIPGLFVSERGQTMTGRECWDYLQKRFQLHPRADVLGITPEGAPVQFWVRTLDFGAAVQVWAYSDPPEKVPIVQLTVIYASDVAYTALPDLVKRYLPRG